MLSVSTSCDYHWEGRASSFEPERATQEQGLWVGVGNERTPGDDRRHYFSE